MAARSMGRLPSFPAHLAAVRPPPNHNLAHGHDILSFPAASRSLALIIPGVAFLPSGNERDANDAMRLLFLRRFMEASVQIQPQICVSIHRSAEGQANHRLAGLTRGQAHQEGISPHHILLSSRSR